MEMMTAPKMLPDDPQVLKQIIGDLQDGHRQLVEKYSLLQRMIFGSKSEKLTEEDRHQLRLFTEAEDEQDESSPAEVTQEITYTRKKRGGRKPLSDSIPRKDVLIDIPEEEKVCACGCDLVRIGEEISEQLDVIPARVQVIRTIRPKYACRHCEGSGDEDKPAVRIAPMPARILPSSLASEGLLAHIVTGKFCDSLPLNRQERIFRRLGAQVSRKNMANWMMALERILAPLKEIMWEYLRAGPLIQSDETTVQVLQEKGKADLSKSYMWVFRGGTPGKSVILFHYDPTRAGAVAQTIFSGYRGIVQSDGYAGYKFLDEQEGILHVGCWAHARRKFHEAEVASGKGGAAGQGMAFIGKLYRTEKTLRFLLDDKKITMEEFSKSRFHEVLPVLEKFNTWLGKKSSHVTPSSSIGKAVSYTLGQWQNLVNYLESPLTTPDNNRCENAIRPFVVGRRNWLFSGSPRGANASAFLYSIVESAKANGLEPYYYLRHLFRQFPLTSPNELESLLPWNLKPAEIQI